MPFHPASGATEFALHGAVFRSYANTATGSADLAAWELELPAGADAPAHVISAPELFFVLAGTLRLSIDGETVDLAPGDAATAPSGSALGVANPGSAPVRAWVTTRTGLTATLADGTTLTPPWAA